MPGGPRTAREAGWRGDRGPAPADAAGLGRHRRCCSRRPSDRAATRLGGPRRRKARLRPRPAGADGWRLPPAWLSAAPRRPCAAAQSGRPPPRPRRSRPWPREWRQQGGDRDRARTEGAPCLPRRPERRAAPIGRPGRPSRDHGHAGPAPPQRAAANRRPRRPLRQRGSDSHRRLPAVGFRIASIRSPRCAGQAAQPGARSPAWAGDWPVAVGPLTRFVVDASAVLHLASQAIEIAAEHELLAPTLLRSQTLSALHEAVQRGEIPADIARDRLTRIGRMPIRLLGDAVLRRRAWELADQLGWASTYNAEYVALTQLQADAFVTLDAELARSVEGIVATASIDALR